MRRRAAFDAASLGVGAALSGIAVYAYAAIGNRALGAQAFAPVTVLWTFWGISAAALAFPIQHWVIRRVHADDGEAGVRHALPRLFAVVAGLALCAGLVGWLGRADLFRRQDAVFPIFLGVIVVGSSVIGVLRGGLAARGRFAAAAGALAGENLIRVALAAVAAAAGWGPGAFGAILLGGFGIAFLWPRAFRFSRTGAVAPSRQLAFLAGISGGSVLSQFVLTGATLAMALGGAAPADVTSMFVALAVFRAPYQVATGVASRITGTLTRLVTGDQRHRLRAALVATVAATLAVTALAVVVALTVGPSLLRTLFGADVGVPRARLAMVGAGSGVALGTLAQGLVLISRARWRGLVGAWSVSIAIGVAWAAGGIGDVGTRAAGAFVIAEVVAFAAMLGMEARALRMPRAPEDIGAPALGPG